ncbi:hypothetical protein PAXRUDRAFT_153224, partial [Paxillus rubicundulus Ve08.2h10]
ITVSVKDSKGGVMHGTNGKPLKMKIPMSPAWFANGTPQPLYFPEGYKKAGWFKGMAEILHEGGFDKEAKLRYECEGFNCAPGATSCCCHHFLFNQPGFFKSYFYLPASTKEADLKKNVLEALSSVPLELMQKSCQFIDVYQKGLDSKQAAWAAKNYHGHHVLLPSILWESNKAQVKATHHCDSS